MLGFLVISSVDGEQYFQPTWTIGHHLSGIFGAPSFGKADADRIRIERPQTRVSNALVKVRLFIVKDLNTVTGRHSYHGEVAAFLVIFIMLLHGRRGGGGRRPRGFQSRRIDKDWVTCTVVDPNAIFHMA